MSVAPWLKILLLTDDWDTLRLPTDSCNPPDTAKVKSTFSLVCQVCSCDMKLPLETMQDEGEVNTQCSRSVFLPKHGHLREYLLAWYYHAGRTTWYSLTKIHEFILFNKSAFYIFNNILYINWWDWGHVWGGSRLMRGWIHVWSLSAFEIEGAYSWKSSVPRERKT